MTSKKVKEGVGTRDCGNDRGHLTGHRTLHWGHFTYVSAPPGCYDLYTSLQMRTQVQRLGDLWGQGRAGIPAQGCLAKVCAVSLGVRADSQAMAESHWRFYAEEGLCPSCTFKGSWGGGWRSRRGWGPV